MHFFTFTLVHMWSSNALTPPCACFLHACRSKYLVCTCRTLIKHMYFVAYLFVDFHSHLLLSYFNINTNIHMKGECKTDPSLYKRGGGIYVLQDKCFKQKVFVFFVTIYFIWNPKLHKDNTCTTIHYHEGDTPLRTACRPISTLRTAYRHVLASRTTYRLKTKQPFLEISFTQRSLNDSMLFAYVQSFLQTLNLVCLLVRFPRFR